MEMQSTKLNKIHALLVILISIFINFSLFAQPTKKIRVALPEFDATGMAPEIAIQIGTFFTDKFSQSQSIEVIEQQQIQSRLKTVSIDWSPFLNHQDIIMLGSLLDADFVIAGYLGKIGDLFTISIKLFNVESQVYFEKKGSYEGSKELFLINTVEPLVHDLVEQIMKSSEELVSGRPSGADSFFKSWYKKWWVWTSIGSAVIFTSILALQDRSKAEASGDKKPDILADPPPLPE